jgi:hypothetical protein
MILSKRFTSGEQFVQYAEFVSGYDFDDGKLVGWYEQNPDFFLTYTGIMQAIRPFVIGVKVEVDTDKKTK